MEGGITLRQLRARYASFYNMICSFLNLAGVFRVLKVHSTTWLVLQTYNVASNSTMIVRVAVVCSEKYLYHRQKGVGKFTEA